jgi:PKD repeat protein
MTPPNGLQPVADFGISPVQPSPADDVRLYDFSYDPDGVGIASRSWDFGDGDTSTKKSPRHCFDIDGTYEVRLAVTTFDGREASTVRAVRVEAARVAPSDRRARSEYE